MSDSDSDSIIPRGPTPTPLILEVGLQLQLRLLNWWSTVHGDFLWFSVILLIGMVNKTLIVNLSNAGGAMCMYLMLKEEELYPQDIPPLPPLVVVMSSRHPTAATNCGK